MTSNVKVGFEIMIETEGPNTTSRASQTNEDGNFSGTTYAGFSLFNNGTANAGNSDSFFGDARRAATWIEHKDIGRVTLDRYESAAVVSTIDLAGISVIASSSLALLHGNFAMRSTDGAILFGTWGSLLDPAAAQGRSDLIRYDSPTIAGFVLSASIAEDSKTPYWGTMLRWAGEYSGFRMAAGIGYENIQDRWISGSLSPACDVGTTPVVQADGSISCNGRIAVNNTLLPPPVAGTAGSGNSTGKPDIQAWGFSLAGLHVPSGLFLQGEYMAVDYNNAGSTTTAYWGETCGGSTSGGTNVNPAPGVTALGAASNGCNPKADAWMWQIQGGITKNFFGLGNTALYGEYAKLKNWGAEEGGRFYTNSILSNPASGVASLNNVRSTDVTSYGLGIVQNIDAAATQLYLGWRHFSADINDTATCTPATPGGVIGNTGRNPANGSYACQVEDFDVVTGGVKVTF